MLAVDFSPNNQNSETEIKIQSLKLKIDKLMSKFSN